MKKVFFVLIVLFCAKMSFAQEPSELFDSITVTKGPARCINADIILVLDFSGSVANRKDFIVNSAKAVEEEFVVSEEGIKVGIVVFETEDSLITKCTGDVARLGAAVDAVSAMDFFGGTAMQKGLDLVPGLFSLSAVERGKKPEYRIVIIVSDGFVDDSASVEFLCDKFKSEGIFVYGVQADERAFKSEDNSGDELLRSLSSGNDFFYKTSYQAVYSRIKKLNFCN